MSKLISRFSIPLIALAYASLSLAGHSPQHERHELMEDVGKAAKPVGQMLKGEAEFDAAVFTASMTTMQAASEKFGDLFPEGSETGEDTEAAPAIWEDREGFNEALATWADAVDAALAGEAATLEDAKPLAGAVFKACKGCHDNYRIDDDH
jgi:cytochrome c556